MTDNVFGECTGCGEFSLQLERHCKCSSTDLNGVTTWKYGDLSQPAFSTTGRNYQHDCPLENTESVETSLSGNKYIARKVNKN